MSWEDRENIDGMFKEAWRQPTYIISSDRAGRHSIRVKAPAGSWGILQSAGMRHYVDWYTRENPDHPNFTKPHMDLSDKIYCMSFSFSVVIRAYPLKTYDMTPGKNPYEYLWGVTEDAFEKDEMSQNAKILNLLLSDCRLVSKKMFELLGLTVEEDEWGWNIIVPPTIER